MSSIEPQQLESGIKKDILVSKEGKTSVPIWEKYALTIDEATKYFGIGETKLRSFINAHPYAIWVLRNGEKKLIKRRLFEDYLDGIKEI